VKSTPERKARRPGRTGVNVYFYTYLFIDWFTYFLGAFALSGANGMPAIFDFLHLGRLHRRKRRSLQRTTNVYLLSSPQLGFFLHLLLRKPSDWDEKHTLLPAAETLKLLSGNPVMHDGRKPLSSFPETFVHLSFLILIQWGAVSLSTRTYAV
jgi:hypothetical protein